MNWLVVIWAMNAAVCSTLAVLHFLVWCHRRRSWSNFFFALTAFATAVYGLGELWMIEARTPDDFGRALWYLHIPGTVIVIGLVGFVRLHLGAGRKWLAWGAISLRCAGMLLNLVSHPNLNFRSISEIRYASLFGQRVAYPVGESNPWMVVSQIGLVFLVLFALDAAVTVWRRGNPRGLWLCGAITFFVLAGSIELLLIFWGIVIMPITVSLFFLGCVLVMGYEMSLENMRAGELSDELRASESRMALAVEAVGLGLWSWDTKRNEMWASSQWRELFGFGPAERTGFEDWLVRLHPDDRQVVAETMMRAIGREGRFDTQFRLGGTDAKVRWISLFGRVDYDDDGHAVLCRGISQDITQQKETEQEVRRQREELAHFSRVTMLGELSATLAHELNQPLGAILRNAEAAELFLQQVPPDLGELSSIIKDIREDDQRAGEVIRRMRSLLRRHEIERARVNLSQLVTEVISLVRPDAQTRRVQIVYEPVNGVAEVLGDRVHLQQVVLNLLLNAMDALKDSAPESRCVTLHVRQLDRQAEVSVSDNGPGIEASRLTRVFEPFYTTKPHGMGMGLSISRTIVEAHGGRFQVEQNEPHGAVFRFCLPSIPA